MIPIVADFLRIRASVGPEMEPAGRRHRQTRQLFVRCIMDARMLTAEQIGKQLAVSKRQIFRLRASGKLPRPVKIGGSIRWNQAEIDKWIALGCPDRATFEARQKGVRK